MWCKIRKAARRTYVMKRNMWTTKLWLSSVNAHRSTNEFQRRSLIHKNSAHWSKICLCYRLATTTLTLKNDELSREQVDEEINAGVVVAAAPTAPNEDDHDPIQVDDRPVERLVLRGSDSVAALLAKNNATHVIASACARRLLTTALVNIDVAGTRLGDAGLGTVIASLTPWLRQLSAPGRC